MELILKNSASIGVVLVAIMTLSIGMYAYNSANASIYDVTQQMTTQEKDVFNSQWTTYEGEQVGSNVKVLVSRLIANANTNKSDETKLPNLYIEVNENLDFSEIQSNLNNINIDGLNSVRTKIEQKHTYFIELHYDLETGLVDAIYVHYNQPENFPTLIEDSYID